MKKLLRLLPLFLLLCRMGMAQTITVIDKTTLQPLAGVVLSSTSGSNSLQTNAKGQAEVSQLLTFNEKLRFTYVGYQTRTLTKAQLQQLDYEVALTQQSYNLHEVVVSAGRFEEEEQLVPQQVDIISQRELNFMSQPTTADVMQQTGKVLVQKSQLGGGSPIIRALRQIRCCW